MFEILNQYQPVYVMEVPNKKTERSHQLWHGEVLAFKEVIENNEDDQLEVCRFAQYELFGD